MTDGREQERLALQARLDGAKTRPERNRLGQFATPTALAAEILAYAKTLLPPKAKVRFLDPAFGTGAFYAALLRRFPRRQVAAAAGFELDPHYGLGARHFWADHPIRLHVGDFTRVAPPNSDRDRATLLICNPPYVRHHHLAAEEKRRLQDKVRHVTRTRLNGLAGLYCYFLGIAHDWMAKDALAGWLIPSEFMDVRYGLAVKEYLLDRVTLLRIHRFDPEAVQFADALVSSALVWFRNTPPPADHLVSFSWGGTLAAPSVRREVSTQALRRAPKWTRFPLSSPALVADDEPRLADFFQIKRGLATGANEFFVLTPEQVSEHRLPLDFLIHILPSPRYVPDDEIKADEKGQPLLPQKRFLLACDRPEEEIRAKYPRLWSYLERGVDQGLPERYICRHRTPWYAQESRPPAPFICTYMGRHGDDRRTPFRFLLNHSNATAPNVYLMLYPKPSLDKLLKAKPALIRTVWRALQQIPPATLLGEGRVYGGGLHKLEPRELANAPAGHLIQAVPALREYRVRQGMLFAD